MILKEMLFAAIVSLKSPSREFKDTLFCDAFIAPSFERELSISAPFAWQTTGQDRFI
jgi:hypothetical protein